MRVYVNVKKDFPSFSFSLEYDSDALITSILGPSGSGKSVFLKIIAGIISPDSGIIKIGERILFDSEKKINIKPQERKVGYLFQNYALFPTMNVYKNLTIALKGVKKGKKDEIVERYASLVGIKHLLSRMPEMLSGGEKQRVALARLLITEPDIILLDEPFSALDIALRSSIRSEMRSLIERTGKTALLVTHDMEESYYMSSCTYLIKNGSLIEQGDNEELYFRPKTKDGASLLGYKNISSIDNGIIKDWGVKVDLNHPFVTISNSAFSSECGDYSIDVDIIRIDEALEKDTYILRTKEGKIISASFEKGAILKDRIYFNRKDLIGLS